MVQPHAVSFVTADEFTDPLVTKEYASPGSRLTARFRRSEGVGEHRTIGLAYGVKELLQISGVTFPPGAFAYLAPDGKLVVRNSETNLRMVERVLDDLQSEAAH